MTEKEWESDVKNTLHPWNNYADYSTVCFGDTELTKLEQTRRIVSQAIMDPAKLSIFATIVADIVVSDADKGIPIGVQRAAAIVSPNTWKEFRYAVMWKIIDAKGKRIGDIPNIRDIKDTCCVFLPIDNEEIYNKYTIEAEKLARNTKDKI